MLKRKDEKTTKTNGKKMFIYMEKKIINKENRQLWCLDAFETLNIYSSLWEQITIYLNLTHKKHRRPRL